VWIIVAGWLAAVLVFSSFFMRTMIPLRIAAIASNVAFIAYALLGLRYGVFDRLYPILVLHSTLLPLNVIRLRELKRMIASVRASSADEAIQALIPYMRVEHHQPGEVIFRRGEANFPPAGSSARSGCSPHRASVHLPPSVTTSAGLRRSAPTRCSSFTTRTRASASF
jgi:hypothetical protein